MRAFLEPSAYLDNFMSFLTGEQTYAMTFLMEIERRNNDTPGDGRAAQSLRAVACVQAEVVCKSHSQSGLKNKSGRL